MTQSQNPPSQELPADPSAYLEAMIATMEELKTLMAQESVLVAKNDAQAHRLLVQRKGQLVVECQRQANMIAKNRIFFAQAPSAVRTKWKKSCLSLSEEAKGNAKTLRGAIEGVKRLIDYILQHIRKEALPKLGYEDPRKTAGKTGAYSPKCPSVAIKRIV